MSFQIRNIAEQKISARISAAETKITSPLVVILPNILCKNYSYIFTVNNGSGGCPVIGLRELSAPGRAIPLESTICSGFSE